MFLRHPSRLSKRNGNKGEVLQIGSVGGANQHPAANRMRGRESPQLWSTRGAPNTRQRAVYGPVDATASEPVGGVCQPVVAVFDRDALAVGDVTDPPVSAL